MPARAMPVTMDDRARADAHVAGVASAYVAKGRPWPWQVAEAWFIRTNAALAR